MYTESNNAENEKEQQFKDLQLEESQALASDNYDLAEEISDRMEQLKAELECARYRLPAQDRKVQLLDMSAAVFSWKNKAILLKNKSGQHQTY